MSSYVYITKAEYSKPINNTDPSRKKNKEWISFKIIIIIKKDKGAQSFHSYPL